jgi:hypothetical protein
VPLDSILGEWLNEKFNTLLIPYPAVASH